MLKIVVSGMIENSQFFNLTHKEFARKSGLSHEQNIRKMSVLTLMRFTANQQVLSFSAFQEKLDLDEDSLEEFVIDAVKSKLVHATIDQTNGKFVLRSTHAVKICG